MARLETQRVAKLPAQKRAASRQLHNQAISANRSPALLLGAILAVFVIIESFIPLSTAVRIGADEGFNLAKVTLCLRGYKLYSDIWDDQPPLHTLLVTRLVGFQQSRTGGSDDTAQSGMVQAAQSVLLPRLVTVVSAVVLLSTFFLLINRLHGLLTATVSVLMLVFSPGFIELASSCMLETPALAVGMAALCIATFGCRIGQVAAATVSGACFGIALMIKFSPALVIPVAALLLVAGSSHPPSAPSWAGTAKLGSAPLFVLPVAAGLAFVAVDLTIDHGAFLGHFHQSWVSHFRVAESFEYGSARDHPLDWSILLKNWDALLPALVGVCFCTAEVRRGGFEWVRVLPFLWVGWAVAFFASHRPWWSYYYIHIALPLSWCGGLGVVRVTAAVSAGWSAKPALRRRGLVLTVAGLYFAGIGYWSVARVYFQVRGIRNSPQTYSSLLLKELLRFKGSARWLYTTDLVYSFHSGIPLPPSLAVVSLKRLWSGEMTNDGIAAEIQATSPELILLRNDSNKMPFQRLLESDYRVTYLDQQHRLYVLRNAAQPRIQ